MPLDENSRRYYLDVMGVQCWELREAVEIDTVFRQLEIDVQQCVKCPLHSKRKQALAGRGNQSADLMFVLLSPDNNDDDAGELCSAEAGELFAKMLTAIDVSIDEVYITSLLKCRVPLNHTVSPGEILRCSGYLKQQISHVQPKLLVVLGETAAHCLLQKDLPLDELRSLINAPDKTQGVSDAAGTDHQFESVPLFVSYSPQELVKQADNKRKAWLDLQQIQKIVND